MNRFMEEAIKEAEKGVQGSHGGPFGAVIVLNNKIIARDHNRVVSSCDPTAHAEVNAIRQASAHLKRFNLSDCVLYTTCEPCPMCLAAIYWARIKELYYGCTRWDAEAVGFDDSLFYKILGSETDDIGMRRFQIDRQGCLEAFRLWEQKKDKTPY